MTYRAQHPEVLSLAFRWTSDKFSRIYLQETDDDRSWAGYYTYVELMLGFCNAVAYAWRRRVLDRSAYEDHYYRLVKLLLTEHYPITKDLFSNPGEYVSVYVRELRGDMQRAGWDFETSHHALREPQPNMALHPIGPAGG